MKQKIGYIKKDDWLSMIGQSKNYQFISVDSYKGENTTRNQKACRHNKDLWCI